MGLDIVELVIRTEEVFDISIPNDLASHIYTVGDLYSAICTQHHLPKPEAAPAKPGHSFLRHKHGYVRHLGPHTPEDLWTTLVALIVDQLQVDESEIRFHTRFHEDLGAD